MSKVTMADAMAAGDGVVLDELSARIKELEAQRDELLEALEELFHLVHPYVHIKSDKNPMIAVVRSVLTESREEFEANARLIAAAPDLLEALEELVDLFGGLVSGEYPPDGFTTQPARDAIAKARGE